MIIHIPVFFKSHFCALCFFCFSWFLPLVMGGEMGNFSRFSQVATDLISRQPAPLQDPLRVCFEKLVGTGGVDVSQISKLNRVQFRRNFRSFVSEVRSIVVFS